VKARLADGRGQFRSDQFVRARIVWSEAPGLTVPVTAVVRINAQFFAFVAEKGEQGTVARQKPVQLGEIVGNDYVVRGGLAPGEQLIVSGLQKIRDGAPVMPGAKAVSAS
jgi:multidrug efflux pump subunit AcrA (membrane-fusion protein)